jgi:hypothetical protein
MNRLLVASVASLGLVAFGAAERAAAQVNPYFPRQQPYYNLYSQPNLSPYLNLLRGGNPAANYYMGVVPERERRQFERQSGAAILELDRRVGQVAEAEELGPTLPQTGHMAYFGLYGSYYNFGAGIRTGQIPTQVTPPPARRSR